MKTVAVLVAFAAVAAMMHVASAGVPVLVMLPLTAITHENTVNNPTQLAADFQKLKSIGVDGVMGDVWWGLCETAPQQYNFTGYQQLVEIIKNAGLKYQAVMSLHRCGGNVGDACNIPLPQYVLDVAAQGHDIFYKDQFGSTDSEYISLFWDEQALFQGRTPIQMYTDYMQAWAQAMDKYIQDGTIVQVEISMGPAGEMRYPSYRSPWQFCGTGIWQASDQGALSSLKAAAQAAGHPEWGNGPPDNSGNYNSHLPFTVGFWSDNIDQNNYASDYGKFFLSWYSNSLLAHGDRVLGAAKSVFDQYNLPIMGKVAGIHWWYLTPQHAAECTAGYYNTNNNNAYLNIAQMFAKHNAGFDFTCFEMTDNEAGYPQCKSGPYELVEQAKAAAHTAGINFSGENALQIYNSHSYGVIEQQSKNLGYLISSFTYLRLNPTLFQGNNFNTFAQFVGAMGSLSG